jgi:hypothetical protein
MKRKPVTSSSLASVGYDSKSQILEVEFVHGGVYQYFDVPPEVYKELINASSVGSYYQMEVRDGGYDYVKIR